MRFAENIDQNCPTHTDWFARSGQLELNSKYKGEEELRKVFPGIQQLPQGYFTA